MKTPLVLVVVALVAGGCATHREIKGPNGVPAYYIKCGAAVQYRCYEEAAEVCPNGYSIIDNQSGRVAAAVSSNGTQAIAGSHGSMFIECK